MQKGKEKKRKKKEWKTRGILRNRGEELEKKKGERQIKTKEKN